jgi:hypothetical protein
VRIQLSDDLAKAVPAGKTLTVKSYTLTVKAFPSGMCRTDIYIDYSPSGLAFYKAHPDKHFGQTVVASSPSDDELKEGSFITKDLSQLTVVSKCGDEVGGLPFDYAPMAANTPTSDVFARATVDTLKDPNDPGLSIEGAVNGATIGVTGKWEPTSSSNN